MAFPLVNSRLLSSIVYHDLFDYPLTTSELKKWQCNLKLSNKKAEKHKDYHFLKGRGKLVKLRIEREKLSEQKLKIAKKAAEVLKKIPTIQFVGITGSLAMKNAKLESDIDLLIITKSGTLWTTRLISYVVLNLLRFRIRKAGDKNEQDKLCLNMWMDEDDLYFDKQNIFTAHEIAQITPLVNKNRTYERLININKWIFDYWPNSLKNIKKISTENIKNKNITAKSFFENICYLAQYSHMKPKMSRELVTRTRAFFHPFDWGEKVMKELRK